MRRYRLVAPVWTGFARPRGFDRIGISGHVRVFPARWLRAALDFSVRLRCHVRVFPAGGALSRFRARIRADVLAGAAGGLINAHFVSVGCFGLERVCRALLALGIRRCVHAHAAHG